jgi:hypothetical protein
MKALNNNTLNALCIAVLIALGAFAWRLSRAPDIFDIILLGVIAISAIILIWEFTVKRHVPPTISANILDRRKMAAVLKEELSSVAQPVIYDLGSGCGSLTRHIARILPQSRITGVEISPTPVWQSQAMKKLCRLNNIEYIQCSMYDYDVTEADAVVMYLGMSMERISAKLRNELKPGALVLSLQFPLPGWQPVRTEVFRNPLKMTLYIYRQA